MISMTFIHSTAQPNIHAALPFIQLKNNNIFNAQVMMKAVFTDVEFGTYIGSLTCRVAVVVVAVAKYTISTNDDERAARAAAPTIV